MRRKNPQTGEEEVWIPPHTSHNKSGEFVVRGHWVRRNTPDYNTRGEGFSGWSRVAGGQTYEIDRLIRHVEWIEQHVEAARAGRGELLMDVDSLVDTGTGRIHAVDVLNLSRTAEVNREILPEEYVEAYLEVARTAFRDEKFSKVFKRFLKLKANRDLSDLAEALGMGLDETREWVFHPRDDDVMVEIVVQLARWTGIDEMTMYEALLTSAGLTEVA